MWTNYLFLHISIHGQVLTHLFFKIILYKILNKYPDLVLAFFLGVFNSFIPTFSSNVQIFLSSISFYSGHEMSYTVLTFSFQNLRYFESVSHFMCWLFLSRTCGFLNLSHCADFFFLEPAPFLMCLTLCWLFLAIGWWHPTVGRVGLQQPAKIWTRISQKTQGEKDAK